MTNAKQLEQTLKDKYLGKQYTEWNAEMDCRAAVRDIVWPILGENSGYLVINRHDHSLNRITLRDTANGIESFLVSIVVKKKKGATHHYGYGRFGGSSTDYTYADFTVTMNEPDLETALQVAIDDIKRQIESRKNKLDVLKQQIETVRTALGLENNWSVKYWVESVQSNWYKLNL
jgi:hypothetical protein